MIAYKAIGEWRGIIDQDVRGEEEELFLAYSDEHAREKAREIARKKDFRLQKIFRVTEKGDVSTPL